MAIFTKKNNSGKRSHCKNFYLQLYMKIHTDIFIAHNVYFTR